MPSKTLFNTSTTASFDVDAQYTFTPVCPDELPVAGGDEIAPALNEQATFARMRLGSKDAHSRQAAWVVTEENPPFSPVAGYPELDIHWKQHAVPGTRGFELLDGLPKPIDYDFFIWKGIEPDLHPYGACYNTLDWMTNKKSTGVIEFLKQNGIETVIVGGLATDYCVANTALQLRDAGFNVVLNLKACRGIAPDSIAKALDTMKASGVVIVDDVAKADLFIDHAAALGL